uniref:Mitochondrial ribosomal protein S34 n=1 Tax=Cyprinus carpio TaxID=7962 RepID=A0A8C2DC80_CYPCA
MVKKKRLRLIAEMARKIRGYRELKNRPQDSQRYALDYDTMTRPFTGKKLNTPLYVTAGMRMFGVGRLFTRKSWLDEQTEPCYWKMTKVKVDYTAEVHSVCFCILTFRGKEEPEEREVDKVMYHDWRLVPKHEEEVFRCCEPVPEPPVRYVRYPPLLSAMILAQQAKQLGVDASTVPEPSLPLKWDALLNHEYFRSQDEKKIQEGTPV